MDTTKLSSLPLELRRGNKFACWRLEQPSEGAWIETPVSVYTGRDTALDDPGGWSTFAEAVAFYQAHQNEVLGIARMLDAHDVPAILVVAFMNCLDEQGHLLRDHPAAQWIRRFNSYSEISHDGRGVKVWIYGTHALGGRTQRTQQLGDGRAIAIYRERQFVALSGQRLIMCSSVVEQAQPIIDGLYRTVFPEDIQKPSPPRWRRQSFATVPAPARSATTVSTHAPMPTTSPLKIDVAKSFLKAILAKGPMAQGRLIAVAADKGISPRTLRRAKRVLRVRSTRQRYQGNVLWMMP
jgi:primase-polymerase (primpol)-like protein